MGKVKLENKIETSQGNIYILWVSDDEEGYGVEIMAESYNDIADVGDSSKSELVDIVSFSFGHYESDGSEAEAGFNFADPAYLISSQWFDLLSNLIDEYMDVPDWIINLDCRYLLDDIEAHLIDLDKIKQFLAIWCLNMPMDLGEDEVMQ
jgi:hypothetical protein